MHYAFVFMVDAPDLETAERDLDNHFNFGYVPLVSSQPNVSRKTYEVPLGWDVAPEGWVPVK